MLKLRNESICKSLNIIFKSYLRQSIFQKKNKKQNKTKKPLKKQQALC